MKKSLIVPMFLWASAITFLLLTVFSLLIFNYSSNIRMVFFSQMFFPLGIGDVWIWITLIAVAKYVLLLLLMRKHQKITTKWLRVLLIAPWLLVVPVYFVLLLMFGPPSL